MCSSLHWFIPTFVYPLNHSLTSTIPFILFVCLFLLFFIHSFLSFIHSSIPSFIHSFLPSFVHPFLPSFIHSFLHSSPSFIPSSIHPFIHSFIHPFLHSFIPDGEWDWDNYSLSVLTQRRDQAASAMTPVKYNMWCAVGNMVHVVQSFQLKMEVSL